MKNILTFDIEEWYEANYEEVDVARANFKKSNLENELREILGLCDVFAAKATFFILGKVAEEKPHLVKMIQGAGHEIASHGYEHKLVYDLSPPEFKEDLGKSLAILESITKEKVLGYRAPSWSFNKKTNWAYSILAELGLKYSASIFPIKTSLYGIPNAPRFPYSVDIDNNKKILEIPTSTVRMFGINIPFSGGAYFRAAPRCLISCGIKRINKESKPAIVYLHPWEIDREAPRLKLSFRNRLGHYWGVVGAKNKLEEILKRFSFGTIKEVLLPQYFNEKY